MLDETKREQVTEQQTLLQILEELQNLSTLTQYLQQRIVSRQFNIPNCEIEHLLGFDRDS